MPWEYITHKPRNIPPADTARDGPNAVSIDTPSWFHLRGVANNARTGKQMYRKMVYSGHNQVMLQADVPGGERGPPGTTILHHDLVHARPPRRRPTRPGRKPNPALAARSPRMRRPRGSTNLSTASAAADAPAVEQFGAGAPAPIPTAVTRKSSSVRGASVAGSGGDGGGATPTTETDAAGEGTTAGGSDTAGDTNRARTVSRDGRSRRSGGSRASRRTSRGSSSRVPLSQSSHGSRPSSVSSVPSSSSFINRLNISVRRSPRKADWRGVTPPPMWAGRPVHAGGELQITTPSTRPRLFGRLTAVVE